MLIQKKHNNKTNVNIHSFNKSFDILMENIKFASVDHPIKSIAILSSQAEEGKSTVALNLALNIANSGQTCLLVDTNFYNWNLSKIIGTHPVYGIYNLVSGKSSITDTISQTNATNLYYLDSETSIPNPTEILSSKRFSALIDYLYDKYDYIIFNTPPLSSYVDGYIVSTLSDGAILSIKENHTEKNSVVDVIAQLEHLNVNILGTVLTYSKETNNNDSFSLSHVKENKLDSNTHEKSRNFDSKLNIKPSNAQIQSNLNDWFDSKGQSATRKNTNPKEIPSI